MKKYKKFLEEITIQGNPGVPGEGNREPGDSRYLSDISFSSNDYALNSLLALLPRRIIIHLIGPSDDFIDTIKLIFENRVSVCEDCNICQTYKIMQAKNSSK